MTSSGTPQPTLDLGRPLRGIDDLERLATYVHQANPKNESDWLEWKIGLDLTAAEGRFEAAKHILGFANRHSDLARRNAGGLAYLVLGLEPGNAPGQPGMDQADLVAGLRRYLSTQGPAWDPIWVPFEGVEVLVLTVEAPAWGDPIHTLRRPLGNFQEGAVFVRHPGRTDPASSEDFVMLSERLRRQRGFELDLLPGDDPLCTLEPSPEAVEG